MTPELVFRREGRSGGRLIVSYSLSPVHQALVIVILAEELSRLEGGMHAGLQTAFVLRLPELTLRHDHPYGISAIQADRDHVRKYPSGHWMTSPQTFEDIRRPFTSSSLVDLTTADGSSGLLVVHDGSQAWFRDERGVRALLTMVDPWDEEHWRDGFEASFWLVPHGELSDSQRARLACELNLEIPPFDPFAEVDGGGDLPRRFGALLVEAEDGDSRPGVLATAFFRESAHAAKGLPGHFGESVRDPFVLRLVEYDGREARVRVRLPGRVARAARTNLLGEITSELSAEACPAPWGDVEGDASDGAPQDSWSALRLTLGPHEVATIYLDLERGRWVPRNLDEHRAVWATTHRR